MTSSFGELLGGLERGGDREPARAADEQSLLAREAAGQLEGLGIGCRDDLVDDRRVIGGRPEVLADALDEVRATRAAGIDRALGVGADDLSPLPADTSLRYLPTPLIVPPVPTPATKCVTLPSVSRQISGPVVS